MNLTLTSPFLALPATLLSGLLLAVMIVRLSQGEFPPALFRAAASLGVVMGLLILIVEAPFAPPHVVSPAVTAFAIAGFPEEAAKLAAVFFFLRPHYLARTPRALVLGAAAVGLGFALTEDVLYIAKAGAEWRTIAAMRAVSAVPVHVFLASISGFAIARSAYSASRARALALVAAAYVAASLLHGVYDLPQLIIKAGRPYPAAVEDLAARLHVSQPMLLHGAVLAAGFSIALIGFCLFGVLGRPPFPAPRPASSAVRRGRMARFMLARGTGRALSGALLLAALAWIALLAVASFVISRLEPLVEGAVFVVFPIAIALALLRAGPPRVAPIRPRLRFAVAAVVVVAAVGAAYHWGEQPARQLIAVRITVEGLKLAVSGDQEGAIRAYDRALTVEPEFADALAKRAGSNSILQRYDRAKIDLDHALRLQPQNIAFLLQRAALGRDMHGAGDAVADLDRALALKPGDPAIVATRAQVELDAGDDAKGADDIARALALGPHQAEALSAQAMLFARTGAYDRARQALDEELAARPGDVDGLFARARLRFYQQDAAKAADDLKRASAASIAPYASMWLFLARARMGIDGRQDLAARAQRWPRDAWPSPVLRRLLGDISASEARASAANDDQRCEADFYEGELLLGRGDTAPALAAFHLATRECPKGFVEYEGALAELRRLDPPPASAQPEPNSPGAAPQTALVSAPQAAPAPASDRQVAIGAAPAVVSHGTSHYSGNAVWSFIDRGPSGGEIDAILLFSKDSIHGELSLSRTLAAGVPQYELKFTILADDRAAPPFSELGAGLESPWITVDGRRWPLGGSSQFQRVDDTSYRMPVSADDVASALARLSKGKALSLELAPDGCKCVPLSFTLDAHTAPVFEAVASAWR